MIDALWLGLFVLLGLAVLSTEFVWARRWLTQLRKTIDQHNPLRTNTHGHHQVGASPDSNKEDPR